MKSLDYAKKVADWMCRTQVVNLINPESNNIANADMNFGRFIRNYNTTSRKIELLSTNWVSGMSVYALLAAYDYAKDPKYLQAAVNGGHYIKALQRMIPFDESAYGAVLEDTHAGNWCHPRDALSGAWGLLRLYRATGDREYLYRAELFADWHSHYVLRNGYPIWSFYFDGRENDERYGSFQAGGALFYYDLYKVAKEPRYRQIMLETLDFYLEHFFDPKEGVYIVYDDATGYRGDYKGAEAWSDMHKYNDDFNAIAIMNALKLTGDERYRKYLVDYFRWAAKKQNADGGFGQFSLSVSSCVAALNYLNAFMILGTKRYRDIAYAALEHLKKSVIVAPKDPAIDGGVLGLSHCEVAPNNDVICMRVTMYTVYAFLLFHLYENYAAKGKKDQLPKEVLNNPMFIGLRF